MLTTTMMTARYAGSCTVCHMAIAPGQTMAKVGSIFGYLHPDCVGTADGLIRTHKWKKCGAYTNRGRPCKNYVVAPNETVCHYHQGD